MDFKLKSKTIILIAILIIVSAGNIAAEVLVETFTRDVCPICKAADEALEQLAGESFNVIILEYHISDQYAGLGNSKTADRRIFYAGRSDWWNDCNYYLYTFFDGLNRTCGGSHSADENYNYFKPIIGEHSAENKIVDLIPQASKNNSLINASVNINKKDAVLWKQKNLTLYFVLREDHVYVNETYPDFRHVVRDYTSEEFQIENQTQINFSYNLNSAVYQNESNIDLIFFVQDKNTKEILSVNYIPLNDNKTPELSISPSGNNSEISGVFELKANASDNHKILYVEFYKNNSILCSITKEPYLCIWNTTSESNGNYTVTVKAYDYFNNVNISEINVFINNKAELTLNPGDVSVSPQNPLENKTVTITAIVRNTGTLDAGNVTVEFLIDGSLIDYKILNISFNSSDEVEFNWTGVLGAHNVTITAGNKTATIPVLVRNCVIPDDTFYVNGDTLLCGGVYTGVHIIVNNSNIVLDCNGAVLNGSGSGYGIYLENRGNVTVEGCNIMNYKFGILLNSSSDIILLDNTISDNNIGIYSENSTPQVNSNVVCSNNGSDIYLTNSYNSSGINNTCDTGNWNDSGRERCAHICFRPDLEIINLSLPGAATEGLTVIIKASIKNSGNVNLNLSRINASLFIDNVYENSAILNLTNITYYEVNFTWDPVKGTHEIKVRIDPDDEIDEPDDTDNERSKNLQVYEKSKGGNGGGDGSDGSDDCTTPDCVFDGGGVKSDHNSEGNSGSNSNKNPNNTAHGNLTGNKTYSVYAACFENYGINKSTVIFLYSKQCSHCAKAKPYIREFEEDLNYSFYWADYAEDKTYEVISCVEIIKNSILPIFICPATGKTMYAEVIKDKIKEFYDECRKESENIITFKPSVNIFISARIENYTAKFGVDLNNDVVREVVGKILIKILNNSNNETLHSSLENLTIAPFEKKSINFSWTGVNGKYLIAAEYYVYSEVFKKEKEFEIYFEELQSENESLSDNYTGVCIVYVYEPDCLSCNRVKPLITALEEKYNLTVKSYNARERFSESMKYFENYGVPKDNRMVPAIFIGNTYLIDKEIDQKLEAEILGYIDAGVRCGLMDEGNISKISVNITENLTEKSSYNLTVEEGKICILLFMSPICAECHAAESYIEKMQEKYPQLEVLRFYINEEKNYELLGKFSAKYNITPGTLAVFIGDKYFITAGNVRDNIETEIRENIEKGLFCPQVSGEEKNYWVEQFKSFGVLAIIFAGLIDGINPCAMASLIFFISYLSLAGRKGRDILLIGIAFSSAVFITYLMIGLGLFESIIAAQDKIELISKIIYPIAGLCAAVFFYFSAKDYFKASAGKAGEMTLQLPKKVKGIIHKIIRKQVRMRYFVLAALTTGFLVSLFEFLCTGQVYLPTIIYITGIPELKTKAIFYLIIYNLLFILPLVLIFLAAYFGATSKKISEIFAKHVSTIKILTALLFFVLALFMFIMSAEMFGIL